jgi:pyruvate/2-oxoglutarate dehydrogenase complex dihydrolipoamide acyltransferase (E2) component
MRANAPADGESSGGRIVVPPEAMVGRADPAVYGDGLSLLLDAVAADMPRGEVEAVWAFPGVRREGREHGLAVITRRGTADKLRIYRARYTLNLKGRERGRSVVEVEETAAAPAELVPRVIEGVRRRADEAGDAEVVNLAAWKAAGGGDPGS